MNIALEQIRIARQVLKIKNVDYSPLKKEENIDRVAVMATEYECSKASKHAILHAVFDLALNAKHQELREWTETGQIYTRDGPNNWKFDPKQIRNERGYSLLHVAVSGSSVKEDKKMQLVRFLIEDLKWDPNEIDLMGRTPLHVAVMSGYKTVRPPLWLG